MKTPLVLLLAASLCSACDRPPEPPAPSKETTASPGATSAPGGATRGAPSGALAWDAPAPFEKVESPSPMRKATYRLPTAEGDTDAPELAVTQVGGSIDANVERWVGQFGPDAKKTLVRSTKKVGAYEVTIVELEGTFDAGGMMGGAPSSPKEGWALLAAIVPAGEQSWFFKMTGPKASVKAARPAFDALVESFRPG